MADKGWIKTYRKIQDCWIWLDREPFDKRSAWIDLLLTANHADKKILFNGELITIRRGQILTSVRKLSNRWGWSNDKTLRFLRLIESDGMLKKESDKSRTLLTIENYEVYQDTANTDRTEVSTPTSTPISHKQECKECKEDIYMSEKGSDKSEKIDKLKSDFDIIYKSYPKKVGKTKGFEYYKAWVTGGRVISGVRHKLTNKQIWNAISKYKHELEEKNTDLEFYKNFDTFMCKAILDYVEEE